MLAASGVNGLLLLLFAVGGFAVVAVVAAVILALIQAVLPGGDTEADALHAEEQKRASAEVDQRPAELREEPPVE